MHNLTHQLWAIAVSIRYGAVITRLGTAAASCLALFLHLFEQKSRPRPTAVLDGLEIPTRKPRPHLNGRTGKGKYYYNPSAVLTKLRIRISAAQYNKKECVENALRY